MKKRFEKKEKGNMPIIAICYDFDKTLSPDDMQAQGFIQNIANLDVAEFWNESNGLAVENDMDQNLAWMYKMVKYSYSKIYLTRKNLTDFGSKVKLFDGVEEWFDRINEYALSKGVQVEHYIISSGLKEMIKGTSIANKFTKIYASSFYFNKEDVAEWPAQVINFTNKTQFLFRIEKGILDINDSSVNDPMPEEKIRIPFRNIVYIGDSDTDVPCMKLVNSRGGYSIGVYDEGKDKEKVYKMIDNKRIKYYVPANYSEGKDLDVLVKQIINKTAANEILEYKYLECKKEYLEYLDSMNEQEIIKNDLILALNNSNCFARTHTVISEMNKIQDWSQKQIEKILQISVTNFQVNCIINDSDINRFLYKLRLMKQKKD